MTKNLPIADTAAVFGEEAKDQRRQSDVYTLKHCFVSVKNSFVAAHLYRSDTPVDTPTNLPCSYALESPALKPPEPVLSVQFCLWGD